MVLGCVSCTISLSPDNRPALWVLTIMITVVQMGKPRPRAPSSQQWVHKKKQVSWCLPSPSAGGVVLGRCWPCLKTTISPIDCAGDIFPFGLFLRKHPVLNFSSPPLSLPLKPTPPGPGQYEIVDYSGPPKNLISSASFVSNTKRWTAATQPALPGPGERPVWNRLSSPGHQMPLLCRLFVK